MFRGIQTEVKPVKKRGCTAALPVLLLIVAILPARSAAGDMNTSNLALPYNPSSSSEDATSMLVNPASLAMSSDLQFVYFHNQFNAAAPTGDAFLLQMGWLGFGVQYARPEAGWASGDYIKYSIPFGVPLGQYAAIGVGLDILQPLDRYGTAVSWSVGAVVRPIRYLSLAITGENLGSPAPFGHKLSPEMTVGAGFRPVGEVLTVSADWHYTVDRHSPPAEFYFRLMPVKGLAVQAMVNWDLSFGVGLFFDLANFGVGAATSFAKSDFSGMTYMGRVSAKRYTPIFEKKNKAVVIEINESLDSRKFKGLESLLGLGGRGYLDVISEIDRARRDRSVEAIVLKIEENPLDLDESDELVRALMQFKARGGKVYAYLESGDIKNAQKYIKSIGDGIATTRIVKYCENETVNMLLSSYVDKAKNAGINCDIKTVVPNDLSIPPVDLCVIIANAVENATNACLAIGGFEQPTITINAYTKRGKLFLEITNPYDGEIKMENEIPVTDNNGHGVGTKSIVMTVEKYGGIWSFEAKNGIFVLHIVL